MQAGSVSNPDAARLADVLAEALCTWEQHRGDDGVFTMALPLQGVDPLQQLPLLQLPKLEVGSAEPSQAAKQPSS